MEFLNMDKRFKLIQVLNRKFIFLLLFATSTIMPNVEGSSYDSANTCGPNGKISRRGRAQMLATIPCDLEEQSYCHLPGSAYPWHAVRRFVHENQGLMKRMYGDVRHISVLRDEIQNNVIDDDDIEMAAERYANDDHRRAAKYLRPREDFTNVKSNVVLEPHFRPVATRATKIATFSSSTTGMPSTTLAKPIETIPTEASTEAEDSRGATQTRTEATYSDRRGGINGNRIRYTTKHKPETTRPTRTRMTTASVTTKLPTTTTTEKSPIEIVGGGNDSDGDHSFDEESHEDVRDDNNQQSNSVYEPILSSALLDMKNGDNIEIIESPQFGLNNVSLAPTISTTVNVAASSTVAGKITKQKQEQQHKNNSTILKESSQLKIESIPSTSIVKGTNVTTTASSTTGTSSNKNINNNNKYSPTIEATETSPLSSFSSSSSTFSTTSQPLRLNADLLSGEKLRRPATISTPTTIAATTKPVLRDGQLFQDTLKQETIQVVNTRGVNACPVKEEVVAPFWANNTRGEVLALLNLYPFEQYVHWEKCTHENKQMFCRDGCRCEQQYRLHRLLAYDPHNECRGIFSDWFRFPSCCICKCYNMPMEFRATSRSPRAEIYRHPIEVAEEEVKKAIYEHATDDWYRPKDDFSDFIDG